ncbi:H(+)-transporting V1 sector ATPase subunit F, partial [Oleoguttula sp. CCFEE 5521]
DSVTGILLAGVGHITDPPDSQKNYLVVDNKTENTTIEGAFNSYTKERKDIAIVLINQHVRLTIIPRSICWVALILGQIADKIRATVDGYGEAFPSVLEIPSKDHPYDPEKDSVMKRVRKIFGE